MGREARSTGWAALAERYVCIIYGELTDSGVKQAHHDKGIFFGIP